MKKSRIIMSLGLLAALSGCNQVERAKLARLEITTGRAEDILSACGIFLEETERDPKSLQDLNEHYIDTDPGNDYLDGWGSSFFYDLKKHELRSFGPDKLKNTGDDITWRMPSFAQEKGLVPDEKREKGLRQQE